MKTQAKSAFQSVPPFRERFPWLGADLQTLRNTFCPRPSDSPDSERLFLGVSGGDKLAARLDRPVSGFPGRPLVILVHGLAGSEASINVISTARFLTGEGWPVLRLNLRGAGPSSETSRGRYHAGRTGDLAAAIQAIPSALLLRGVVLLGHSLGGNLILKFLGEGVRDLPILGGVAVSTPLDLASTCARMMHPRNLLYHHYMLSAMKQEALSSAAALTAAQMTIIANARSIFEFDDRFVAPLFGYRGAADYYRANSSGNFLSSITFPTLIIHALNDPWIPQSCYDSIDWKGLHMIETKIALHGGHLGFHGVGSPIPWHDRIVAAWLRDNFLGGD